MKRVIATLAALVVLTLTVPASAEVTVNVTNPIAMSVWVPCANGGTGEYVRLSGELHILVSATINNNRVSGTSHFQPMGVSGVGQTTGDKYQGTGVTRSEFSGSLVNDAYEYTYVNNFRIVGQGSGNNFLVHQTVHITINAGGTITADVNILSSECK